MKILKLITIMTMTTFASLSMATEYHCNGRTATTSTGNSYHANGKTFTTSGNSYHPNGKTFKSTSSIYHPNGKTFKTSSSFYYANGKILKTSSTIYHANGKLLRSSSSCYHPSGSSMGDCPRRYKIIDRDSMDDFETIIEVDLLKNEVISIGYVYREPKLTEEYSIDLDGRVRTLFSNCE